MIKFMTLGNVCTRIVDCPHETPEWKSEGIAVIRNFNLKDGRIDMQDGFYVDDETFTKRTKRAVPSEGDIIFSREAPIGNCAIVPKGFKCCLGQRLVLLQVNHEICSSEYLLAVLQSSYVKQQIEQVSKRGSIVSNFAIGDLHELVIPVLDDQEIVAKLTSYISEKISNNNAICSDLEGMAKLLYDYWFVQFDFPDENGRPYKSSGGKMVWNEELKREIPDRWETNRIGNLILTERGISYSTDNIKTGKGVPMLNLASFMPGGGEYKADGLKHFLGEYPKNKVLQPYDLIMCNTQQTAVKFETDIIGRAMLVPDIFDGDVVFSHHVNVIRTQSEDMRFYLLYLFNSDYYHKYISGFTNGTNILGLSFSGVEDYITEIPASDILERFGKMILAVEKKKSDILLENEQLASLRDFLLPMLMNGQVKIGKDGT